ncbi:MAG: DNA repair protein RecN [Paracoccaceae bacterium]|nr:DNA repair protein RecN [Paracoccaceae bacterium]
MLKTLDIRDMLIIDRLELTFQPGLNVLTGETGAGKSILLDSMGFVLGWRGRADLVREGSSQGEVTAVFALPSVHPARAILAEMGVSCGDELILRRINSKDGRKTAWINERRCSGEALRLLSEVLVELHGQHDDRGLLNAGGHRNLLDEYAGHKKLLQVTKTAFSKCAMARVHLQKAQAESALLREEEEFLRYALKELDALAAQPGEEAELDALRRLMQASERIRENVVRAHALLTTNGADRKITDAVQWLNGAAEGADGRLDAPLAALARALVEVDEAVQGIECCLEEMSFNPSDLDDAEERLFAIRGLARKHQISADAVPELGEELRGKLAKLDQSAGNQVALEVALKTAELAYDRQATQLTAARKSSAVTLDTAVMAELAPLKMDRAVFTTQVTPATSDGPKGRDVVAFEVATNPGAPSGTLAKIASGGELSRFLLALKVCLTAPDGGRTMIFDEIDRGVGGATADAVGRRLSSLAQRGQILVVTHSPQVAALGQHHWRVEKHVVRDITTSTVELLDDVARIDEIARMLSGDVITAEARAAAQALLP